MCTYTPTDTVHVVRILVGSFVQLFKEAGLDVTEELTDHLSKTLMGSKQVQPQKITTDEMELNDFGEAILRATEGLDNRKMWVSI